MKVYTHTLTIFFLILKLFTSESVLAQERDPIFSGIWSHKVSGKSRLQTHNSFKELSSWSKKLSKKNRYLANVEVYQKDGKWVYKAISRIGPGNFPLRIQSWDNFEESWKTLKATKDLIDIEVIRTSNGLKYLGVWRQKQDLETIPGALLVDLTWSKLNGYQQQLKNDQYLADVETYTKNGKRLFAGLWRRGKGGRKPFQKKNWKAFTDHKKSHPTRQMLDFEMFQSNDGQWNFVGVWRKSNSSGSLHASKSRNRFIPLDIRSFSKKVEQLKKTASLIGVDVAIPLPDKSLRVNPKLKLLGDTNCQYGAFDCNQCATDVPSQFHKALESKDNSWIGWRSRSWSFDRKKDYPPDNLEPKKAFSALGKKLLAGLPENHIQGFVRTNSSRFPLAGSHSHKDKGSIFIIEQDGSHKKLHSLYKSSHHHPSGVSILGDRLFVAESNRLRWFNVSESGKSQNNSYVIPKVDPRSKGLEGGGGIGLVKLTDGSTLLIMSAPGGAFFRGLIKEHRKKNLEPRYTRFYRFPKGSFNSNKPNTINIEFLGEWRHEGNSEKPKIPTVYSENLSVITECRSGVIYTIHTTGEWGAKGNGFWRLSKLVEESGSFRLIQIGKIQKQEQSSGKCHHRSSATVSVYKDKKLEFLCSERDIYSLRLLDRKKPKRFHFLEGFKK